jgi:Protein of unknown function (DUF2442)
MSHRICRIESFQIVGPYTLQLRFDDGATQTVDLAPVLEGELYGPLRDRHLFDQVRLDPEVHTVVWPNGADFDPATLYDWPQHRDAFATRARAWAQATV